MSRFVWPAVLGVYVLVLGSMVAQGQYPVAVAMAALPILLQITRQPMGVLLGYMLVAVNLDAIKLGGDLSLDPLAAAGMTLLIGFYMLLHRHSPSSLLARLWLPFVAASALSLLVTPYLKDAFMGWGRYVEYFFLIGFVAWLVRPGPRLHLFVTTLIAAAAFPAALGLFQVATGTGAPVLMSITESEEVVVSTSITRAVALVSHPNFLAFFLMIVVLLGTVYLLENRDLTRRYRLGAGTMLALSWAAMLATLTRGALMGSVLALAVYGLVRRNRWVIGAGVVGLPAMLALPGVGSRLQELMDLDMLLSGRTSLAWRLAHWGEVLDLSRYHPFVGTGFKSVYLATGAAPHNEYLGTLIETGWLGGACFFALLASLALIGYRLVRARGLGSSERAFARGYACVLFAILVTAVTDNVFSVPSSIVYFWLVTGAVLTLYGHARRLERADPGPSGGSQLA